MTHDEIIEVIKAHRDGKDIEFLDCGHWHTATNCQLKDTILGDISRGYTYRVQPEPTYVPWTPDCYKDFSNKWVTQHDSKEKYFIDAWNHLGICLTVRDQRRKYSYEYMLESFLLEGEKPCGKLVKK